MTFAKSKFGKTLSRAGNALKRQFWVWPVIAICLLSLLGYLVHGAISSTMKSSLASELETLLNVETEMLHNWYAGQKSLAESIAKNTASRQSVRKLVDAAGSVGAKDLSSEIEAIRAELRGVVGSMLDQRAHRGFLVFDREQRVIAGSDDDLVGKQYLSQFSELVPRVLEGNTAVTAPFASIISLRDSSGNYKAGVPTMFVAAPVYDENLQVIAALALRLPPEKEFTRILQIGRIGKSGETYAFDRNGLMVSNSRFDHDLILFGLLPDQPNSQSILSLLLRDPGGDMTSGYRPNRRRSEMPMTKMAASATAGHQQVDVEGYGDYRGVKVVGAWKWLPEYGIGVATELDASEAFYPLIILSRVFWGLYALLLVAAVAIFIFSLIVSRMQREAQKAAVEAQELGQYRLEEKLGAGAMGIVYKGYHAMMRRPTAIKLLNVETMSESAIARFEHEVQITSQLNHPNTIAIYDYGRTPEGVFYYAMEYLDGIDLQNLVQEYGPQPEARVIQILIQICGSLFEAHAQGLVHRDIKPANIMLNRRGGQPDVVKVLDFGLVKHIDTDAKETGLAGTPLYMSPEAIQSPALVDACSDIYAVGAVGYFLITGKNVFESTTLVDLIQKHVAEPVVPPSQRCNMTINEDFENVLLSCLEKARARRPQTSRELAEMLNRCEAAEKWKTVDAEAWWAQHDRRQRNSGTASSNDSDRQVTSTRTNVQATTARATAQGTLGATQNVDNSKNQSLDSSFYPPVSDSKKESPLSESIDLRSLDQTVFHSKESNDSP